MQEEITLQCERTEFTEEEYCDGVCSSNAACIYEGDCPFLLLTE